MTRAILGLDVGGANLKAATPDGRAAGVPFALWKQPDRLPAALAELISQFPDAGELAVTMTGELCDCFETKRDGVLAILDAVEHAAAGRPVRVWGTGGGFLGVAASRGEHMAVAAANWHALATFVSRWVPDGPGLLLDIGSTTSDLIPLRDGRPDPTGRTDEDRLASWELVYTGVGRTPVCAVAGEPVAAELFATTRDVYQVLGLIPDAPDDRDTADGRPATRAFAHARLCRMLCGDPTTVDAGQVRRLAAGVAAQQVDILAERLDSVAFAGPRATTGPLMAVLGGSGEFLGRMVLDRLTPDAVRSRLSLADRLGPAVSACAPAFAVAVLASERPCPV